MAVTTYFSASKGFEIPLTEMEENHLNNAICKLESEQASGAPIPVNILSALKEEQAKRKVISQPKSEEAKADAPAQATPPPPDLGVLVASLTAVAQQLTAGLLKPVDLGAQLQELATAVNKVILPPATTASAATACSELTVDSPLIGLDSGLYPALTSRYLLNSLAAHGIRTLSNLASIAPCDFGAVRFSTADAFVEASELFQQVGLTWGTSSVILAQDGFINHVLNPNASPIATFVTEASSRLQLAVEALAWRGAAPFSKAAIDRIFNGIKRRLSLAANVVATVLLARGITDVTSMDAVCNLTTSAPFKNQVRLYLDRVFRRVAHLPQRAAQPEPVTA